MAKRYFEFKDAKSHKFWEVSVSAKKVNIRYGKVGTDGQTSVKELSTPAEAKDHAEKQAVGKVKKGYKESIALNKVVKKTAKKVTKKVVKKKVAKKSVKKTAKKAVKKKVTSQITIHGSGGEIIIGEIGKNKYSFLSQNSDDQENYIFGDHDGCNKVDTFWGISTQATIEVEGSGEKKKFKKEIEFKNLATDTNITYRKFKETKYYFLGFSMNNGESLSCVINEEFEVSRLKFCFVRFSAPEIADIILTDVSYVLADSGDEIQFSSDGDTTHKGNLFDIFRGSDCEEGFKNKAQRKVKKKFSKKRTTKTTAKKSVTSQTIKKKAVKKTPKKEQAIKPPLTKAQIKTFKEVEAAAECYEDFRDVANNLAEAGDTEWSKKVYKKAEKEAENEGSSGFSNLGHCLIKYLGDKTWAKRVYEKALVLAKHMAAYDSTFDEKVEELKERINELI